MTLAIQVSPGTEAWLERKATASGADKASVASRVLDQAAEKEMPPLPHSPEDRLRRFRAWTLTVPARPGPPVDTREYARLWSWEKSVATNFGPR